MFYEIILIIGSFQSNFKDINDVRLSPHISPKILVENKYPIFVDNYPYFLDYQNPNFKYNYNLPDKYYWKLNNN